MEHKVNNPQTAIELKKKVDLSLMLIILTAIYIVGCICGAVGGGMAAFYFATH